MGEVREHLKVDRKKETTEARQSRARAFAAIDATVALSEKIRRHGVGAAYGLKTLGFGENQ